jgi:hypothetical protein
MILEYSVVRGMGRLARVREREGWPVLGCAGGIGGDLRPRT